MNRQFRRLAVALALFWASAAVAANIPRPEHPNPQAVRPHWANLNGPWQFRFDADDKGLPDGWFKPDARGFDRTITVPFGWESELSGIHELKGPKVGWYRRTVQVPDDFPGDEHVWLHFGAVGYEATVWVNGKQVARHEGGYTPFSADITDAVKRGEANTVVVRAFDPTDPSLPTGKQVGWYTPTSGIWQTVWLESRPTAYISSFDITTAIDPARTTIRASLAVLGVKLQEGEPKRYEDLKKRYTLAVRSDDASVAGQSASINMGMINGGLGNYIFNDLTLDVREPKLWMPDSPHLYEITLELKDGDKVVDSIQTYFGFRTVARGKYGDEPFERVLLNGRPIFLRGALDQSFNPKGVYTAPSDDFLKQDIADAKKFGLNFLRIHIKPDEPRRLYWADKLGMLIMEDMPNTWAQNERARTAWEHTMREVVARDRNHPAIFAWVDFNETWGLGRPDEYKRSDDTQQWVKSMVKATRELDPTRLVEDNSPCNYDHVEGTDLNSWHFYIDDAQAARRHVAEVVEQSHPGSGFNYCPDEKMNSAPLINSEYGAVGAGSGDRDVSWGFRDLTTILRKYPKIQGYIYTELSDIEWEHNGFLDYDRTPKAFGYDAFVPGMTVADLQGADFVGYDSPPAIEVKPDELIEVPVFVSHYSDRKDPPTLKWWVAGIDGDGREDRIPVQTRAVEWSPYTVTRQAKPIKIKLHSTFVGAIALVLEDAGGERIAANFVNVVVRPDEPRPRVERVDDHTAALRFAPDDAASSRWSEGDANPPPGKIYGRGSGSLVYRLKVPSAIVKANPDAVAVLLELSSKGGREQVDWNERTHPQDYPQTDARTWPSTVEVVINGQRIARLDLPDDPADARGVLSHLAGVHHGSHGELIRLTSPLPDAAKADLAAGRPLIIRLRVPEDAPHAGGLALYGANNGAFAFDPTFTLHTADELPADLGVKPGDPIAVDTLASRRITLLAAGDSPGPKPTWSYTTRDPGAGWAEPGFDTARWERGRPGFGTAGTPSVRVATRWDSPAIWLRTEVDVPALRPGDRVMLHLFHDEDVAILVNGKPLHRARGYTTSYGDLPLDEAQRALFQPGKNVIAVSCKQTGGGQGVEVGLTLIRDE